jgi:hypothetical protein
MCKKGQYIAVSPESDVEHFGDEPIYLSLSNPYILGSPREKLTSDLVLMMPNDILLKAIYLDSMDFSIKFICLSDLLASIFYFMLNIVAGLFTMMMALTGYCSSVYHSRMGMFCYTIYQYLQLITKGTSIFLYLFLYIPSIKRDGNQTSDDDGDRQNNSNGMWVENMGNNTNMSNSTIIDFNYILGNEGVIIPILIILFCLQFYISYFVHKYFTLLPSNSDLRRLSGFSDLLYN